MKILMTACVFYYILSTVSMEAVLSTAGRTSKDVEVRRNNTATDHRKLKPVKKHTRRTKNKVVVGQTWSEVSCTSLGRNCQPKRFICQGRYLDDKCSGGNAWCCLPDGAWSVLCAGHYNNRVRACDVHGCGAFNSRRGAKLHKAVDLVCDDYGLINAPFSGTLSGPVTHTDPSGIQYEGVKLVSPVHCVKLLNMRPYRYMGSVARGGAVGYLLPLQDRFAGITSHLKLQMCDGSDPTPFIWAALSLNQKNDQKSK